MIQSHLTFTVHGMHCASCVARVQNALAALPGVADAAVNQATHTATITLHPNIAPHTTPDIVPDIRPDSVTAAAIAAVERLGFRLEVPATDDLGDIDASLRAAWKEREATANARLHTLRARLIPMFACALALLILSMGHMLGMPLPAFLDPAQSPRQFALLQLVLTIPVVWLGKDFYISGLRALVRRAPNMDSLVALGTGAAFVYSLWHTVGMILEPATAHTRALDIYYESVGVLLAMITLGNYFEALSRRRASDALGALMRLVPDVALRLERVASDGPFAQFTPVEVPVKKLCVGDTVLVKAGSRVPVDGVVLEGASSVDISLLTGESLPVSVTVGDALTGGSVNGEGILTMKVTRVGRDTVLARILRLVQEAQGSKAPMARLADRVSAYFVPVVICIALASALAWYILGQESAAFALRIFVSVLVMACPCAMGLATPMSVMVATGRAAQLGVLIKSGVVLEQAARLNALAFDKTGTLTTGIPRLTEIVPAQNMSPDVLLSIALALETRSEHPLARALMAAGAERTIQPLPVTDVTIYPGMGLRGTVTLDGQTTDAALGNLACMLRCGMTADEADALEAQYLPKTNQGASPLFLSVNGTLHGVFLMADVIRPEASSVVARLRAMGLRLLMVSGDNARTARTVARQVGIEEVHAAVLPHEKERILANLRSKNLRVGMVGDGINDAPALAYADVGIVVGDGVDVSVEAGDIVLMRGGIEAVFTAISIARAALRNMRQNLFWAFAYNVLGLPVAAGVLYIFGGPTLSPMLAGTAMALSSVSVVCNALRLRKVS